MGSKWQANLDNYPTVFASISKFCWHSQCRQHIIYAFACVYIKKKKTNPKNIIPCQEFPLIFHNERWRVCKSWSHKKKLQRMNFSFAREMEEINWSLFGCTSPPARQFICAAAGGAPRWGQGQDRATVMWTQQSRLWLSEQRGLGTAAAWLLGDVLWDVRGERAGKAHREERGAPCWLSWGSVLL